MYSLHPLHFKGYSYNFCNFESSEHTLGKMQSGLQKLHWSID